MKRTRLIITLLTLGYCILSLFLTPEADRAGVFQTSAIILAPVVALYQWSEGKYPTSPR